MMTSTAPKCSIHSGNLILVNSAYTIKETLPQSAFSPANSRNDVLLERRAGVLLNKLMHEIRGWNNIVPVSGWRSEQTQHEIWNSSIKEHGRDFTEKYVAFPGCSEHQTGLAIDLGLKNEDLDFIRPDFPYTGICQTFRKRAAQYGFIQRYPAGKEHITGIAHEPWHFRFVGIPHAVIIDGMDFTLEEYHDFLRQFPHGEQPLTHRIRGMLFEVSYLSAAAVNILSAAEDGVSRMISGNNVDGFVVTAWKD